MSATCQLASSVATSSVPWPPRLFRGHFVCSLPPPPPPPPLSLSLFRGHLVCSIATSSVPWPPRLFRGLLVHLVCSLATSSVPRPPRLFRGLFVCSVASSSTSAVPWPPCLFLGRLVHLVCSVAICVPVRCVSAFTVRTNWLRSLHLCNAQLSLERASRGVCVGGWGVGGATLRNAPLSPPD